MSVQSPTQQLGKQVEEAAQQFLIQKGLRLIVCNYQCRMGEIDLIMQDKEELVFVEVRYRKRSNFGTAAESVTLKKQMRIARTAQIYLREKRLTDRVPCRFDVVACTPNAQGQLSFEWIAGAFEG